MKFFTTLAAVSAVNATFVKFAPAQSTSYLKGFLGELLGADKVQGIEQCIRDETSITDEMQAIIIDLKSPFSVNIVYDIMHKLAGIIAEMPTDLRECLKPGADLVRITKWSNNVLGTPDKAFLNIVDQRKELKNKFKALLKHIKKSDFKAAGKVSAKVMTTILGEVPAEWDEELVYETPFGPYGAVVDKVPVDAYGVEVNAVSGAPMNWGAPYAAAVPETFGAYPGVAGAYPYAAATPYAAPYAAAPAVPGSMFVY